MSVRKSYFKRFYRYYEFFKFITVNSKRWRIRFTRQRDFSHSIFQFKKPNLIIFHQNKIYQQKVYKYEKCNNVISLTSIEIRLYDFFCESNQLYLLGVSLHVKIKTHVQKYLQTHQDIFSMKTQRLLKLSINDSVKHC